MKRIHIPNNGPDPEKVKLALATAFSECRKIGGKELAIITPMKNLDQIVVGEVLGKAAVKTLMSGGSITVEGVNVIHRSVATVQKGVTPRVGVAFHTSKRDIQKLDDLHFDVLAFVPWLEKEGQEWASKWNAESADGTHTDSAVDLPAEVIQSLTDLTTCVNLSTGLGHPSDMDHAKRRFSNLRRDGLTWNPAEVEKWAVRNRWRPQDAQELAKLSARYT